MMFQRLRRQRGRPGAEGGGDRRTDTTSSPYAWRRFAAADLDGDRKSGGDPHRSGGRPAPRSSGGTLPRARPRAGPVRASRTAGCCGTSRSSLRLVDLDGSGRKGIAVIADQEKAGRQVVILDPTSESSGPGRSSRRRWGFRSGPGTSTSTARMSSSSRIAASSAPRGAT